MSVTVDPHPLPRFRANGALMNMPAFAQAFDCKAGDPMVKPAGAGLQNLVSLRPRRNPFRLDIKSAGSVLS